MKTKRILAAVLAMSMAFAALSGCGKKEKKVEFQGDGSATELSMFMHFFGYCVYNEDWPIWKEAEKRTGIKITGVASESISDSSQAYNTMLVSKTLPDIIHYTTGELENLAVDGGLIPLDDLIDEYAPNLKEYFETYPEAKHACTVEVDGEDHIYYINGSNAGIENGGLPAVQKGWFIRTDWIKKLGLEVPKTLDEFYNVLTAFRNNDPNGNGKKDEVPLFERQEGVTPYLQLFDAYNSWHLRDGKVVHGRTEEEYKNAMKELHKWYKEGLIDQEIFTRGQQSREQLLGQNIGGCTSDWFSSTSKFNDRYADSIPGFEFMPIDPPADIKGVVKEASTRPSFYGEGWGISKDCKDTVAAIKYMDFWMSPEGKQLISFGIEGVHSEKGADGKYKYTEAVLSAPEGVPNYMRNQGQVEIGTIINIEAELAGMNEVGRKGFERYIENKYAVEPFECTLTTEESVRESELMTDIDTYMREMQQKWILGEADVDATWDEYIATINEYGYPELVEIRERGHKRALE